jgi:hypothetical protein
MDTNEFENLKKLKRIVKGENIKEAVEECKHWWHLATVEVPNIPQVYKRIWYCQKCRKIEDFEGN